MTTPHQAFIAALNDVADDIAADHAGTRNAVAAEFSHELESAMERARGTRWLDLPVRSWWTEASDGDFESATMKTKRILKIRAAEPVLAEAAWNGAALRQRGSVVYLEGKEFALMVAMFGDPTPTYNRRQKELAWNVFVTDAGKLVTGHRNNHAKLSSAKAKSAEGADASLKRIVKDFFGVELVPVGTAAETVAKKSTGKASRRKKS